MKHKKKREHKKCYERSQPDRIQTGHGFGKWNALLRGLDCSCGLVTSAPRCQGTGTHRAGPGRDHPLHSSIPNSLGAMGLPLQYHLSDRIRMSCSVQNVLILPQTTTYGTAT
eukprot:2567793-Rhodomonas_salina.2